MNILYRDPYRPSSSPRPWRDVELRRVSVISRGKDARSDQIAMVLRAPNGQQVALTMSGDECFELLSQIFATGFDR